MLLPVPVYLREVSQNLRRSRPRACERRHGSCAGSNWISRLHPWRTDDVLRPWKDIHSEEACRQWMVDVAQGSRRLFGWRFGRSLGDDRGLASTTHIHVPKRSPQQHQCHSTPLSTSLHPYFERYTRRNALGLILASSCRIYIHIFSPTISRICRPNRIAVDLHEACFFIHPPCHPTSEGYTFYLHIGSSHSSSTCSAARPPPSPSPPRTWKSTRPTGSARTMRKRCSSNSSSSKIQLPNPTVAPRKSTSTRTPSRLKRIVSWANRGEVIEATSLDIFLGLGSLGCCLRRKSVPLY